MFAVLNFYFISAQQEISHWDFSTYIAEKKIGKAQHLRKIEKNVILVAMHIDDKMALFKNNTHLFTLAFTEIALKNCSLIESDNNASFPRNVKALSFL